MLKIRLTRKGKKNKAFFRLVVAEHTSPVKGRFIEVLGFVNPHTKEKKFEENRIKHWLGHGAQCSDSVHNLLVKAGIIKGPKRAVKMKKKEQDAENEEKAEEKSEPAPDVSPSDAGREKTEKIQGKKEEKPVEKGGQSGDEKKAPENGSKEKIAKEKEKSEALETA